MSGGFCKATCGRCPVTSPTGTCMDRQPTDGTACSQRKLWGHCSADWLITADWCAATCGRCSQPAAQEALGSGGCTDVTPAGGFTCAQQAAWGKVGEGMGACVWVWVGVSVGGQ